MKRPAAFLDRDGTIVTDSGFLRDPDAIEVIPGAAEALIRLRSAGFLIILVTNQSGIARGLFDWNAYRAVAAAIERRLGQAGARIDATYVCPHHPSVSGPCD
ncbi:MAG: HAD-IIIA family hydrolase, partial [Bauldia sp.]